MSEIITTNSQLPSNVDDLTRFVLVGHEKLQAVRAEIRAIKKVGLATEVYEQKLKEAQEIGCIVIDAETRLGELTAAMETHQGGDHRSESFKRFPGETFGIGYLSPEEALEKADTLKPKTKTEKCKELGFGKRQISEFEKMAKHPELVEQAKTEAIEQKKVPTRADAIKKIKQEEKKAEVLKAEQSITEQTTEELKPTLYVGDGVEYLKSETFEKYDLLLTDPPYSTDVENIEQFVEDWLFVALNNVKDTGFAYVFIGAYPEEVQAYLNAYLPKHIKLEQMLVWTYKNTLGNNPKDRYKLNYQLCLFYRGVNAPDLNCPLTSEQWAVQEINAPDGRQGDRYHAWQKPMEIGERFIRHSTEPGMTVFDPFACTGTFLLAAAKLGRKSYGFEINPEHAAIAFERGCLHE